MGQFFPFLGVMLGFLGSALAFTSRHKDDDDK